MTLKEPKLNFLLNPSTWFYTKNHFGGSINKTRDFSFFIKTDPL